MEKTYDVIVRVQHSTSVEIKASSEEEAIEKAIEAFDDGEIKPGIEYSGYDEYYDGLVDVTADEII